MQAPPWSQGAEDAEDAELQAALAASLLGFPAVEGGPRRRAQGGTLPSGVAPAAPRGSFPAEVQDVPIEWREEGENNNPSPAPPASALRIEEVDAGTQQGARPSRQPRQRRQPVVVDLDSEDEAEGGGGRKGEGSPEEEEEGSRRHLVSRQQGEGRQAKAPAEGPVTWQQWGSDEDAEQLEAAAAAASASAAAGAAAEHANGAAGADQMWAHGAARWQVEDEDPELQAALAMSLKSAEEEEMVRRALAGDAGEAEALGGAQRKGSHSAGEHAPLDLSTRGGAGADPSAMPRLLTSGFETAYVEPVARDIPHEADRGHEDMEGPVEGSGAGEEWRVASEAAARESTACGAPGLSEPQLAGAGQTAGGNGVAGQHEDLAGITEEEREIAAMYEAALFGVPYAPSVAPHGPPAAAPVALPAPSSMAYQQHQELLRQWESMQQRHSGEGGGVEGLAAAPLGGGLVSGIPAGVPDMLRGRQLLQPRRRRGGRVRESWEDPMEEDEEDEPWDEEEEGRRWRRGPREPDAKTIEQRLLREQQDDEYQMSLMVDREKEERARREAEESRRQEEEERARRAAEEESRKQAEEAYEARLREKSGAIPAEPEASNPDAVTILVRTPDGTRRSRRFLRSELFQTLLDFIETERICREGTYQLVRQFPNRVFSPPEDGQSSFQDLGLTSKQEALFIRLL